MGHPHSTPSWLLKLSFVSCGDLLISKTLRRNSKRQRISTSSVHETGSEFLFSLEGDIPLEVVYSGFCRRQEKNLRATFSFPLWRPLQWCLNSLWVFGYKCSKVERGFAKCGRNSLAFFRAVIKSAGLLLGSGWLLCCVLEFSCFPWGFLKYTMAKKPGFTQLVWKSSSGMGLTIHVAAFVGCYWGLRWCTTWELEKVKAIPIAP